MKITVLGSYESQSYRPDGKAAIIRIGDELNDYHLPPMKHLYEDVYAFQFYDIEPRIGLPTNWNHFSQEDGRRMLEVFEDIRSKGYDEVVIHCFAGASRSPAVSIAMAWFLEQEEDIPRLLEKTAPNAEVLKVMSRLLGNYEEHKTFIKQFTRLDEEEYVEEL